MLHCIDGVRIKYYFVIRIGKVQPIIDMIKERFTDLYNHSQNVSIDEAMIPFKGRSSLKQYMPLKPVKRGIKVWTMADGITGYISQFEVYTGKKGTTAEKGLGSKVVKSLSCQLQYKYKTHIIILYF